jgi:hypothetical protein
MKPQVKPHAVCLHRQRHPASPDNVDVCACGCGEIRLAGQTVWRGDPGRATVRQLPLVQAGWVARSTQDEEACR